MSGQAAGSGRWGQLAVRCLCFLWSVISNHRGAGCLHFDRCRAGSLRGGRAGLRGERGAAWGLAPPLGAIWADLATDAESTATDG